MLLGLQRLEPTRARGHPLISFPPAPLTFEQWRVSDGNLVSNRSLDGGDWQKTFFPSTRFLATPTRYVDKSGSDTTIVLSEVQHGLREPWTKE